MSVKVALSLLVILSTTSAFAQRRRERPAPIPQQGRSCTLEARISRSFDNTSTPGIGYSVTTGGELLQAAGAGVPGTRILSATLHVVADQNIITAFKFDVETNVGIPSGAAVSIPAARRRGDSYPAFVDVSAAKFILGAQETVIRQGRRTIVDANGELEAADLDFNITGSGRLVGATIVASGPGCR